MRNVLLIHTHDTGRHLSPYGYSTPSPNLQAFAKDATVFRQAFCASPTCSPSRACMLTGRYAHNNGMLALSQRGTDIRDFEWHLSSIMKQNGYQSVLCGVQHERAFWRPDSRAQKASLDLGYELNISTPDTFVKNDTDLLEWDKNNAKSVVEFIKKRKEERPFFLSYGMHATHRIYPELTKEELDEFDVNYIRVPETMQDNETNRYDTACLHKSIKNFDECFEMVINALKESGQYENTVVISTTDHGLANPFGKCSLRDAGIGVSFIMRVPEKAGSHGKVYDGMVSQIDLIPTLAELLGIAVPEGIQGESFSTVFEDIHYKHREEIYAEVNFHTSYEPQRCVRTQRYKYIRYFDETWKRYNLSNCDDSVVKSELMENGYATAVKDTEYLFDLLYDPMEKNNVIDREEYQEVLTEMRQKLESWQKETDDKILCFDDYNGKIKVNKRESIHASSQNPDDYESLVNK